MLRTLTKVTEEQEKSSINASENSPAKIDSVQSKKLNFEMKFGSIKRE